MRIGFTGPHRSGKTTLATAVADRLALPLLTSRASSVAAEFGFDMAKDNRLTLNGMVMQEQMLSHMLAQLDGVDSYVCDRTPIDAAAYLLADATASAGTSERQRAAVAYAERAMRLTAKLFDVVILIPPAIEFEPAPGKPPMNVAYQEHHHMLVRGMLFDDEVAIHTGQIERTNIGRENRLTAALEFISTRFASR